MKNNIKIIIGIAIAFLLCSILVQILSTSASYTGTPFSATTNFPGAYGQLMMSDGLGGALPISNAFATTSPNGGMEINIGAYAKYPNPAGMGNFYDESSTSPVLSTSFMGSTTQYVQVYGQNLNPAGSFDFVLADDKGTATSTNHYGDLGIANSTQIDTEHTLITPFDTYLFSESSRLILGSATTTASSTTIISSGMTTSGPSWTFNQYGQIITHGNTPTCSSGCGTSPTITGNNNSGVITLGAGLSVTAATMTFADGGWPTGTNMSCQGGTNSALTPATYVSAISNTSVTFGLTVSLGGGKIYYNCNPTK